MNELVIIGQDMNKELIIKELEVCLCTLQEWEEVKKGKKLKDPFPQFS
jgi:soluble P-type ATPase